MTTLDILDTFPPQPLTPPFLGQASPRPPMCHQVLTSPKSCHLHQVLDSIVFCTWMAPINSSTPRRAMHVKTLLVDGAYRPTSSPTGIQAWTHQTPVATSIPATAIVSSKYRHPRTRRQQQVPHKAHCPCATAPGPIAQPTRTWPLVRHARWCSTATVSRSPNSTPGTLPLGQTARTYGPATSTASAPTAPVHLPPCLALRTLRPRHQSRLDSRQTVIAGIPPWTGTRVPRLSKRVPSRTPCSSNSTPLSTATARVFGQRTPTASAQPTRTQLLARRQPRPVLLLHLRLPVLLSRVRRRWIASRRSVTSTHRLPVGAIVRRLRRRMGSRRRICIAGIRCWDRWGRTATPSSGVGTIIVLVCRRSVRVEPENEGCQLVRKNVVTCETSKSSRRKEKRA